MKRILYGAVPSKLLLAAIELDIFSHLREPMSAGSLAGQISTHSETTRVFLDALVANDLLCKRGGRYWNTPLVDEFLVQGQPTYLGDLFLNFADYMWSGIGDLPVLVRHGPPARRVDRHPSLLQQETKIYANYQRAGRAQQAAAIVSSLPEFAGMKRMLDLGGGAGLICMAIVAAHPTMTGIIFDRPEVVEVALQYISEYELEERVKVMGGDYTTDSIGEGYDLVWSSYTLLRSNLEPVMREVHRALNPGGVYANLSEGLTDERTRPTMMVNSLLSVSLRHGGSLIEAGDVVDAMLQVGFRSVHSRVLDGPQLHGPGLLDVARK